MGLRASRELEGESGTYNWTRDIYVLDAYIADWPSDEKAASATDDDFWDNDDDNDDEDDNETFATKNLELYNLAGDISEKKNLASAEPDRVKIMLARAESFMADAVPNGATTETHAPASAAKPGKAKGGKKTTP